MQFKSIVLILLAVLTAGSVGARAFFASDAPQERTAVDPASPGKALPGVSSLAPSQPGGTPESAFDPDRDSEEGAPASEVMPYVTEGSFFALIGFALGYLSRKLLKLALILLALLFLAVQGLSYAEVLAVDWDRALQLLNDLVLNLKENQTLGEMLKDRLPSAGGLAAGYALGFRKG